MEEGLRSTRPPATVIRARAIGAQVIGAQVGGLGVRHCPVRPANSKTTNPAVMATVSARAIEQSIAPATRTNRPSRQVESWQFNT